MFYWKSFLMFKVEEKRHAVEVEQFQPHKAKTWREWFKEPKFYMVSWFMISALCLLMSLQFPAEATVTTDSTSAWRHYLLSCSQFWSPVDLNAWYYWFPMVPCETFLKYARSTWNAIFFCCSSTDGRGVYLYTSCGQRFSILFPCLPDGDSQFSKGLLALLSIRM